MNSILNPYFSFHGNAREAMEFYKSVFGGELTLSSYGENHMPAEAGDANNIMHAMLKAENGMVLMGSDAPIKAETPADSPKSSQISISLSGDNEAELRGYWDKLVEGGTVLEPLAKAPWGDTFGMLSDKFGICWMVNISAITT